MLAPKPATQAPILLSPPELTGHEVEAVAQALATGYLAPAGPTLHRFEEVITQRMGIPYAVALSSGTAAIHLGLKALGVGPGDRVLCPSFTFAATVNPIHYLGAEPVFVGCEAASWGMCPDKLNDAIKDCRKQGRRIKAVILVHNYGQPANAPDISRICQDAGIALLEDAAEALGSQCGDRPAGGHGQAAILSFNGNKIITCGMGGMLLLHDADQARQAASWASQCRLPGPDFQHDQVGYNYRLSNIAAAVGLAQLADLPRRISARRSIWSRYAEELEQIPGLFMNPRDAFGQGNCWLSAVTLDLTLHGQDAPQRLHQNLHSAHIESRFLWNPLHRQAPWRHYPTYGVERDLQLHAAGLCLPSGSQLTPEQQQTVVQVIKETLSAS